MTVVLSLLVQLEETNVITLEPLDPHLCTCVCGMGDVLGSSSETKRERWNGMDMGRMGWNGMIRVQRAKLEGQIN